MMEENLLWKWMSRRPNGRKLDREKASNLSFKEAIMGSSRATIWTWKMAKDWWVEEGEKPIYICCPSPKYEVRRVQVS